MLEIIYNYSFFFLAIYLTTKTNNYFFKFDEAIFALSLIFHLSLTFIYIKVFSTGDWESYIWEIDDALERVSSTSFLFSSHLIITISAFLQKILLLKQVNIILVFSLLSFFGIAIFLKNLFQLGFQDKYMYLFLFIPSIHFWTCIPGKDSIIIFCTSFFFYFYINKKIFIPIIFLLIIGLLRPHVGAIFFISFLTTEFLTTKGFYKKIFIFFLFLLSCYTFLLSKRTGSYFIISTHELSRSVNFGGNLFFKMLAQLNNISEKFSTTGSAYESGLFLSNIFKYILFPPEFIFKKTSAYITFSILIETSTFILISTLISFHTKILSIDKKLLYFLSISISLYLLILPQVFFNYGLNIRQKWMIVPFIIYFSFLVRNLFVKIKKT